MDDLLGGVDSLLVAAKDLLGTVDDILAIGLRLPSGTWGLALPVDCSAEGAFFCMIKAFLSVGTCFARSIISSNGISWTVCQKKVLLSDAIQKNKLLLHNTYLWPSWYHVLPCCRLLTCRLSLSRFAINRPSLLLLLLTLKQFLLPLFLK